MELFDLTVNIETQVLKLFDVGTFKVFLALLFVSPFFIFIFSAMFIILIDHILFICFSKYDYNKSGCCKVYSKKLVCKK